MTTALFILNQGRAFLGVHKSEKTEALVDFDIGEFYGRFLAASRKRWA
jgi:hypothetical protein